MDIEVPEDFVFNCEFRNDHSVTAGNITGFIVWKDGDIFMESDSGNIHVVLSNCFLNTNPNQKSFIVKEDEEEFENVLRQVYLAYVMR